MSFLIGWLVGRLHAMELLLCNLQYVGNSYMSSNRALFHSLTVLIFYAPKPIKISTDWKVWRAYRTTSWWNVTATSDPALAYRAVRPPAMLPNVVKVIWLVHLFDAQAVAICPNLTLFSLEKNCRNGSRI